MRAPVQSDGDGLRSSLLSSGLFFLLASILPVVLPFVRRAAPVFLVFAALLIFIHIVRHRLWREVSARLAHFPVCVGTSFLIWAGITCLWAPVAVRSWESVGSGLLIFISGLSLFISPPERSRRADLFAALALSFAALILIIDLKTGEMLLHIIHSRPDSYRYNMVLVSLVILSFGLFHQDRTLQQPLKYIAVFLLMGAVFVGESETAKIALLVGYIALFLAPLVSRLVSLISMVIGVVGAWVVFLIRPDVLAYPTRLLPAFAEQGHAAERIQIWIAYSEMARAGLPWGWGVESVANVSMTAYFKTVPEASKPWLEWLHPHNNAIQIAAEMGWPGIVLGLAASGAMLLWAHEVERLRPARVGLVCSVIMVALFSHGFWQMWWWSAVVVAFWALGANSIRRHDSN